MILEIILKGFLVGLAGALPFGPVAVYCIKKSLVNGGVGGYFMGFGASTVDALFALIAVFGVITIKKFLITNGPIIGWGLGLLLVGLGIKEFFSAVNLNGKNFKGKKTLMKEFLFGFSLAIANPFVILSFIAVFAVLGMGKIAGDPFLSALLVISTFFGAFLGLTTLNWIVIHKKEMISGKIIDKINKIVGIILSVTGIYFIIKSVFWS